MAKQAIKSAIQAKFLKMIEELEREASDLEVIAESKEYTNSEESNSRIMSASNYLSNAAELLKEAI